MLLLIAAPGWTWAQSAQERVNAIINETQKQGNRAGRVTIVWWMPTEFWRATGVAEATLTTAQVDEMVAAVQDVIVFAIIDGKLNTLGAGEFTAPEVLRKNISLSDAQGKPIALLPEEKQSVGTKNLLAVMRPVWANMLGEFGKNLSLFVFEGKNKDGSRRIDPTKPGSFVIRLSGEEFRWRLPLGSLLPSKTCPKCNENYAGNYAFCPFDATPLKEQPSEKKEQPSEKK